MSRHHPVARRCAVNGVFRADEVKERTRISDPARIGRVVNDHGVRLISPTGRGGEALSETIVRFKSLSDEEVGRFRSMH